MSRDISDLHPSVQLKAMRLIGLAKERLGLNVIITQTRRTEAEQKALFSQGRGTLVETNALRKVAGMPPLSILDNEKIVTKASSVTQSFHGYGLAFDIAIVDATGKKIDWTEHSDWNNDGMNDWAQVGSLAQTVGLEWGGNWSSMPDPPHYQDRMGYTLAQLKTGVGASSGITVA